MEDHKRLFKTGWRLGCEIPEGVQLNNRVYDDHWLGDDAYIATALDYAKSLYAGKTIPWRYTMDGWIPMFASVQKTDPRTGEPIKWRIIRHAGEGEHSINLYTPECNYRTNLPLIKHLMVYMYAMYKMWGFNFRIAKTDLKGAFRQLYLNICEWTNVGYKFEGLPMADTCDIWGTKAGSKHTQDYGQILCRAYTLTVNGTQLSDVIKQIIEEKNVNYVKNDEWILPNSPHLTRNEIYNTKFIPSWDYEMIERWVRSIGLYGFINIFQKLYKSGLDILTLEQIDIKRLLTDSEFEHWQLLIEPQIRLLKYDSDCILKLIIQNYIDDYFLFLPPLAIAADTIFEGFQSFLTYAGVEESIPKREGPDTDMEVLGLDWAASDMTVGPTPKCLKVIGIVLAHVIFVQLITIKALESLIGKLSNIAILIWPGKAFIRRLRELLWSYIRRFGRSDKIWIIVPEWAVKDLRWWREYLCDIPRLSIINLLSIAVPEFTIYVDGATNGHRSLDWRTWCPAVGGFFDGLWFSEPVPKTYLGVYEDKPRNYLKEYAIPHFEMLSVVVALNTFAPYFPENAKILIRTDNTTVESVLKKKDNKDLFLQDGLRWSLMFARKHHIRLWVNYIWTEDNVYADLLSRFDIQKFLEYSHKQNVKLKSRLTGIFPNDLDRF